MVSAGVLEPIPLRYQGRTVYWIFQECNWKIKASLHSSPPPELSQEFFTILENHNPLPMAHVVDELSTQFSRTVCICSCHIFNVTALNESIYRQRQAPESSFSLPAKNLHIEIFSYITFLLFLLCKTQYVQIHIF